MSSRTSSAPASAVPAGGASGWLSATRSSVDSLVCDVEKYARVPACEPTSRTNRPTGTVPVTSPPRLMPPAAESPPLKRARDPSVDVSDASIGSAARQAQRSGARARNPPKRVCGGSAPLAPPSSVISTSASNVRSERWNRLVSRSLVRHHDARVPVLTRGDLPVRRRSGRRPDRWSPRRDRPACGRRAR
jgi:hypothetical protein